MWFIFRHGETMHNRLQIKQGRYPSLLTLKGIDQIKSIGYRILDYENNFDNYELISSPMVRTRHSMQIVQEILGITDKKIIEEELIAEINAGDAENISKEKLLDLFPDYYKKKEIDPMNVKFPNGESRNEVKIRIKKFFEKVKDKENLIICTHGSLVKRLAALKADLDIDTFCDKSMNQNYFYICNNDEVKLI